MLLAPVALAQEVIEVTLREGTNMAAAVSPDGRSLAVDLQGRLWTLPIEGGAARALTDELGDVRQPTYSPDGSRIAFQSYRDGMWHIWSVGVDGAGLTRITHGPFDDREPHYARDGATIVFASDRGGSYDLWSVELATGELEQLTFDPGNEFTPAWSPDGGSIAFISEQDDSKAVKTLTAGSQTLNVITELDASASAPAWSPDGSQLAVNVINELDSRLVIIDVDSGVERTVSDDGEDVFPFRAHWISSSELLYTADGRVRRRSLGGGAPNDIELTARVELVRHPYVKKRRDFDDITSKPVRGIVTPAVSPDGSAVALVALGDLWLLENGMLTRLTDDRYAELQPAFSRDGSMLVYASDREGSMDLWIRDMDSGDERRLTDDADTETMPVFSPDGTRVGYHDASGRLQLVDVDSGDVREFHQEIFRPGRISFSPDGSIVALSVLERYSTRYREGRNEVLLVSDVGSPERQVTPFRHRSIGVRGTDGPVWSPDGQSMAFTSDGALWVAPVNRSGEPIGPPRRYVDEIAESISWTGDSRSIVYVSPHGLKRVYVHDGSVEAIPLALSWARQLPTGRLVVHAGRLFDGINETVRRNVDVIIDGHRIRAIAPHAEASHAAAGRVIDASAETVIPGLIEMHTHQRAAAGEALGRIWLAYGITSVRELSANPFEARERLEAIASGKRPGPREFFTGSTFDGARTYYGGALTMDGGSQVAAELERAHVLDYDFIKTYVRLSDPVQKRVVAAAHEMGIPVTSHELYPAVAYGGDGTEHYSGTSRRGYSSKISRTLRSYQDIIELLARSGMTMTPTIGIFDFALAAIDEPAYIEDERFGTLFPASLVVRTQNAVARSREKRAERVARLARLGKMVKDIHDAGGRIIAGTDSPILPYAVSLHAELHHFVNAGLTPFETLQTATIHAAEAIGVDDDLGSIEAGKLADIVIVDGNPLDDIHDAMKVRTVIKNGNVYELEDLLRRP